MNIYKYISSRKEKGFTLIELLVVIAIIALLSSVVLASLNTAREKARDARRLSDLKQVQTALELYYQANGQYPADGDTVLASINLSPYISPTPSDPSRTGTAGYRYSNGGSGSDRQGYTLLVYLEKNTTWCRFANAEPRYTGWNYPVC